MSDMDSMNIRSPSALALGLSRGDFSAVDLINAVLKKIETHPDPAIFITLTPERALRTARQSDSRRARRESLSPWDGIPVAWKDLFDFEGVTTTAGSDVYRTAPAAKRDAELVSRAEAKGLIAIGKTNLSEFAYSGLGLNPHYGTPKNPASDGEPRVSGGSSSGSAAAVAAGLVPLAVGTDTAGSIRVPASFCGLWGYKASHDRYSKRGVFPLSASLDSLGFFANSARDLLDFDTLMAEGDRVNDEKTDLSGFNFVVPQTVVLDDAEPDVLAAFEKFLARIRAAGGQVRHQEFPVFAQASALFGQHGTLTVAEAYTYHSTLLESADAARMDQRVRARMETAKKYSAQDYIRLQWEAKTLRASIAAEAGNDFVLFPTVAFTAPLIAPLAQNDELFAEVNLRALRNTMLGNYLEMPGVTLPIGVDAQGLPIGALLSAPHRRDREILAVARAMEAASCSST